MPLNWTLKNDLNGNFFFIRTEDLFIYLFLLFIFGCVGSSFLCEGFL